MSNNQSGGNVRIYLVAIFACTMYIHKKHTRAINEKSARAHIAPTHRALHPWLTPSADPHRPVGVLKLLGQRGNRRSLASPIRLQRDRALLRRGESGLRLLHLRLGLLELAEEGVFDELFGL